MQYFLRFFWAMSEKGFVNHQQLYVVQKLINNA